MNTVFVRALDRFGIVRKESSFTFQYDSIKPDAPTDLRLVNDTGASAVDHVTSDPTLIFTSAAALKYEFSLNGAAGPYLPLSLGPGGTFLPSGLAQGTDTVFVRAVDSAGNQSDAVSIALTYDTAAPGAPTGLRLVLDSGASPSDGLTNYGRVRLTPVAGTSGYEYSLSGSEGTYAPVMFGQWMTFLPTGLAQGTNTVFVRAVDAAGNRSAANQVSFRYDTIAPTAVPALSSRANGVVTFKPVEWGATYQYRIAGSRDFVDLGSATRFRVVSTSPRPTVVWVRAVDAAGNRGPERGVLVHPASLRAIVRLRRALALKVRHARLTWARR
jgi:hypothetical protein